MALKLATRILKRLPESWRYRFYRSWFSVPDLAWDENFRVEIASSEKDLECAYRVLHDAYVATQLMTPHASGLRCNLYSFLPHTTVIVAKYKGEIVGTVSLIRDSVWGLPSDKDYRKENDTLRDGGRKLVEVSALAVAPSFRNAGNAVSFLLMKYIFNYSAQYWGVDHLVCTVHPRAQDFYKALSHFQRNGGVIQYPFVQGALAVHLSMLISAAHTEKIIRSYPSKDVNRNLMLFFLNEDPRLTYPSHRRGAQIDPVLTPELFERFCVRETGVWNNLTSFEKNSFYHLYFGMFGYCNPQLQVRPEASDPCLRDYRIPTEILAVIDRGQESHFAMLTDLSKGGAFLAWSKERGDLGSSFPISFKIGSTIIRTTAEVIWKNDGSSLQHPHGIGIKFKEEQAISSLNLQSWLYDRAG